jgi:hypothetical protein
MTTRYNCRGLCAIAFLLTLGLYAQTTHAQTAVSDETPVELRTRQRSFEQRSTSPDATAILRSAKTIYVKSSSVFVGEAVIETKLLKRAEFQQLGLIITRDPEAADLILELRHDVLTKYVYTAIDPHTQIVVASGKLSSLGGTVAGKVAKRFLKQMVKARLQAGP